MNKIRAFAALSWQMKVLLLEAYVFLGWARLKKEQPFHQVAGKLGEPMTESSLAYHPETKQLLASISAAIEMASRYTWWESKCLVQALAVINMLKRRKIPCTLYLGTARDCTGELVAHAWVRSGPFYMTGQVGMECYTVVGQFAVQEDRWGTSCKSC